MLEHVELSRSTLVISGAVGAVALAALYRWLLPRPIPGIPFNHEASRSIWGDLPAAIRVTVETRDISSWFMDQLSRHKSPIAQVFMKPFSRPYVVLADSRETEDILLRRKEFERSEAMKEIFEGSVRRQHIRLDTNDQWKAQRRLLKDLMTPRFLHGVAAPVIWEKASYLIELWELKAQLANGRPFSVFDDMYYAALDAVMAFSFGSQFGHEAIRPWADMLAGLLAEGGIPAGHVDEPAEFPRGEDDEVIAATLHISEAIGNGGGLPLPAWRWWLSETFTSLGASVRKKNEYIRNEVEKAVANLQKNGVDHSWTRSAVDQMILQETILSEKQGRKPDYFSEIIQDEIFGFIEAGHDTTSTTLLWALKLLADHPDAQNRLRSDLQTSFSAATAERRLPTSQEIHDTSIPYLDATMEEILRLCGAVHFTFRDTKRDTEVLGNVIPRGTTLLIATAGPSLNMPAHPVDEARRSQSSRDAKLQGRGRTWSDDGIGEFEPGRWLVRNEGSVEFDSTSGPMMAFGLGVRGCFGRKLAYVDLRTILVLTVWRFELLKCPEALSGYESFDSLTRKPKKAFVRLKTTGY